MKDSSKTLLYWFCQLLGWGIYIAILILSVKFNKPDAMSPQMIVAQFIIGTSTLFASHGIRWTIKKKQWLDLGIGALILRLLMASILGSILSNLNVHILLYLIFDWFDNFHAFEWSNVPIYVFNLSFMLFMWSILYVGFKSIESARKNKIEKLTTQTALKDAELIALKAQINPHFLFNSLNNIRALILQDQMKARDMVTNLSDILRYSIEFSKREKVTIAEEIDILKNYLDLESIQYDGRLNYQVKADENTLNCIIPPMVIQTLAENAVKHGISQLKEGGEITIEVTKSDEDLEIRIANTGQIKPSSNGTGIGIKNATSRIQWLFNAAPSFTLAQKEEQVVATLILPAKYESDIS
ncbi:sensor histidine kinase [Reichenbachiella ulvae]|uniref:Histidine kinase n=1 Tax=Reichenbachiella ulvae TaxID=2980104 RepID=A0ABT3CYV2_9BACT|nr:histidine kinase [Reichenbachiella ulvae]MCV9388881.1 histidine kinase [Reichenbachiella ulvae]